MKGQAGNLILMDLFWFLHCIFQLKFDGTVGQDWGQAQHCQGYPEMHGKERVLNLPLFISWKRDKCYNSSANDLLISNVLKLCHMQFHNLSVKLPNGVRGRNFTLIVSKCLSLGFLQISPSLLGNLLLFFPLLLIYRFTTHRNYSVVR